ncbi:cutinase family protein [Bifidobacterium callimiconis]|uniref:Cutinase n=1 Tax=Bifidobacterium callimiconis TaxID=2306973 RepID=A0A430F9D7_9BIFI|nr:cutinase family protein [Bifidobacterium callimiconis]RSX49443.1 cutinase [Bifidobacterium callimiconis]
MAMMLPLAACSFGGNDGSDASNASGNPTASSSASSAGSGSSGNPTGNGGSTADSTQRNWGDSGCDASKAVRVIIVRGTGENADDGLLNPVAADIANAFPNNVQTTSLDYPATFDLNSVNDGVTALVAMMGGGAQQCPNQKTVLLGFSQGAAVVGDALSKPKYRLNTAGTSDLIPQRAADNMLATVLYGDPRFNGKADYNAGGFDATKNGMLAPRSLKALAAYARTNRIVDYCAANDIVCQEGGVEDGHRSYFSDGTRDQGTAFAVERIRAAGL